MEKGQGPVCVGKYESLLRPSAKMSGKLMQNVVSRHREERPKETKSLLGGEKGAKTVNRQTAFSEGFREWQ